MFSYHGRIIVRTYVSVHKVADSIPGFPAKCFLLGGVMSNTSWLLITKSTYLI